MCHDISDELGLARVSSQTLEKQALGAMLILICRVCASLVWFCSMISLLTSTCSILLLVLVRMSYSLIYHCSFLCCTRLG